MIKEHTQYNINDAVYSIKMKIAAKPSKDGEKVNIPSFASLFETPYSSFKASVVCLKILVDNVESKDKILIYQIISSEVNKAMAEDLDSFDSIIIGNYIFGIFYTPMKESMKRLIDCLAKMNSTILLFKKISKITGFDYAIAADFGDVFFLANKDSKGKIVEYNWFGKIFENVGQMALEKSSGIVRISNFIYNNIPENYQSFFSMPIKQKFYSADIVNSEFYNWKDDNVIINNNK
jgi:hypothetical protein